ncbi:MULTISPECIES: TetR/AcrR family transcriptional regulator [Burkholderia]|uniref:TetR/AcrR family transcriptional regulator n=1 Tax=Burkholderia TaxID=32008 RepID=UPI00075BEA6C|nr:MULTISPECIES: TetR/AcrR family transcriptional regulator [Burkholderia]AOJ73315.1 TetR family transcriptional regulator [Burkholderia savannae]KVG45145.1 TetR family transcriptional regulator [Burkholderia sp. MSMB0265]KVG79671.1 TetR family transcriptional regulator [Burkholderia sp. MSMB2040]KVG96275.1 TetR family transcriptional regulator [Burkholderia sp. MSMB2041]KVG97070.1 TetR family transcriptional regulator [Burkholderia sp. MSMB2042]
MRNRNGNERAAKARDEAPARSARCRLPADVRIHQILDAALAEFSASGFVGARIDDIAARAGMSKGGVYTHFGSKDEIFEALLERSLMPPLPGASKAALAARRPKGARKANGANVDRAARARNSASAPSGVDARDAHDAHDAPSESDARCAPRSSITANARAASSESEAPAALAALVDLLAGDLYTWSTSEPVIAMLRLLVAESRRAPHAVERWQKQVEHAVATAVGRLVRQGVDAGELRAGIAARTPLLLVAPLTQACLRQALRAAPATRRELAASRRDYARFIEELLT